MKVPGQKEQEVDIIEKDKGDLYDGAAHGRQGGDARPGTVRHGRGAVQFFPWELRGA